jgi:hypothetical protein
VRLNLEMLLIAKYSDLLGEGERSPRNFHEQLQRLGGEVLPLNIFASINNMFTFGPADVATHAELEAEFLSDSIKNKLERSRRREPDGEPLIIFSRIGALIVLKLLLATRRVPTRFRSTAVGACALHANDYAESLDVGDLSHGLLPVVAEYAATWELQNPRHVGTLLRRINYIYKHIVLADERIRRLTMERLGCTLSNLTFAGMSYERYLGVLFGLYVSVKNSVVDLKTSIVDVDDLQRRAEFPAGEFDNFLCERSSTASEFRSAIGSVDRLDDFVSAVALPGWCADIRIFRDRPLLRLPDARFVVLDMQFLIENASAGLYWTLARQFGERDRGILFSCWGDVFEEYVKRLLRHYVGESLQTNVTFLGGEADAIISAGDDRVLLEIKAGFISQDAKGSRDRRSFDAAIRKKYVGGGDARAKGVTQLARAARELISREERIGQIYPVLVVDDPALQTFATNSYIDEIFRAETNPGANVKPLTLLLIDELEEILPHISAGDTSWQELLESRFVNGGVVVEPMHTSLTVLASRRGLRRRSETFLQSQAEDLNRIISHQYGALRGK